MNEVSTTSTTTTRPGPVRQYLHDLPGVLRTIRADLSDVRDSVRELLPFVWRSEAYRRAEDEGFEMFHLGFARGLEESAPEPMEAQR